MQKFTLKDSASLIFTYNNKAYQLNVNIQEGLLTLYKLLKDNKYSYREALVGTLIVDNEMPIVEAEEVLKELENKEVAEIQ